MYDEVVVTRVVAVWLRDGEGVTVEVWCVVVPLAVPLCVWMMIVVVSVDVLDLLSVLVDVVLVVAMLDVWADEDADSGAEEDVAVDLVEVVFFVEVDSVDVDFAEDDESVLLAAAEGDAAFEEDSVLDLVLVFVEVEDSLVLVEDLVEVGEADALAE